MSKVNALKLFHIVCESVVPHQTSIKRWKVHCFLRSLRRFRHMYQIIICGLDVALLSSGLFLSPLRVPLLLSQSAVVSPRRDVCPGDFIRRGILHGDTCACRWRAHVVNQRQREQSENARCESPSCENRRRTRADAAVHPLTLALCRLTERPRCTYAHMCCRTMTRSVDDASTRTETGTRRDATR